MISSSLDKDAADTPRPERPEPGARLRAPDVLRNVESTDGAMGAQASALLPIADPVTLSGGRPHAHAERNWDDDLIYPIAISHPKKQLRTLRDAGEFLSGTLIPLAHSPAHRQAEKSLIQAAKTGAIEDVSAATDDIDRLVRAERLSPN